MAVDTSAAASACVATPVPAPLASTELPSTHTASFSEQLRLEPSPVSETSSGTGASFFVAKASTGSASDEGRRMRGELRLWLRGHPAILEQLNDMVMKLKRR